MTAQWIVRDGRGKVLGQLTRAAKRWALRDAAQRWPFAPHPIRVTLAGGRPSVVRDWRPMHTPEAHAKRAATLAKKAAARRAREAKMSPSRRAWWIKHRKRQQSEKWRRYYLAKQPPPAPPNR